MKKTFLFLALGGCCTCFGQTNATIAEGNRYYSLSEFDMAETSYRKVLETDPNNTTAQFNLANALQKQKKYDEAEKLLEHLGNSSHDKSFQSAVWYNQGVAYSAQKNLESSIESYKKSLRLNPNDQQVRENLEKALLELKKKNEQQKNDQKKQDPKMSQKEAEQKLKLLEQKERELQQRQQKKQGAGQAQDW